MGHGCRKKEGFKSNPTANGTGTHKGDLREIERSQNVFVHPRKKINMQIGIGGKQYPKKKIERNLRKHPWYCSDFLFQTSL